MEYLKRREGVSLVVLCNTEPVFIHDKWMRERNIITSQEYDESKGQSRILRADLSTFRIGSDISVYCDKNRFQIECTDITAAQRMIDICRETIKLNMPSAFAAVGVNAAMDFTFINQQDAIRFGDTFVPLEQWRPLVADARVGGFTIQGNDLHPSLSNPRRVINIQSIGQDRHTQQPLVRISINNHYPIKSFEEMVFVFGKALGHYKSFMDMYDRLFSVQLS